MIRLDRTASTPLGEQLAEQLRFHIGTGRFRPGDPLPSTRELGRRLDVSFHTVRKAYQALEAEGRVVGRPGSGYAVADRAGEPDPDRMERGAAVAQDAVHRLAALGLSEEEIDYVLQEQLAAFEPAGPRPKVVFATDNPEWAEPGAAQVSAVLQVRALPVSPDALARHPDADLAVVPFTAYAAARRALPEAEVVGALVYPCRDALAEVARLGPSETLGVVTRQAEGVGPTLHELRAAAGFGGQALALPAGAERERLAELVGAVDLVVYTTGARRRVRPLLGGRRAVELTPVVEASALSEAAAVLRR